MAPWDFDEAVTSPADGAIATVLVGEIAGATSPARRGTALLGVDLDLCRGSTVLPLHADWE